MEGSSIFSHQKLKRLFNEILLTKFFSRIINNKSRSEKEIGTLHTPDPCFSNLSQSLFSTFDYYESNCLIVFATWSAYATILKDTNVKLNSF